MSRLIRSYGEKDERGFSPLRFWLTRTGESHMDGWIVSQSMSKYYDVCLSSSNQESQEDFCFWAGHFSALFGPEESSKLFVRPSGRYRTGP